MACALHIRSVQLIQQHQPKTEKKKLKISWAISIRKEIKKRRETQCQWKGRWCAAVQAARFVFILCNECALHFVLLCVSGWQQWKCERNEHMPETKWNTTWSVVRRMRGACATQNKMWKMHKTIVGCKCFQQMYFYFFSFWLNFVCSLLPDSYFVVIVDVFSSVGLKIRTIFLRKIEAHR